jgi:hypothetical protein
MKRLATWCAVAVAAAVLTPALRADVKTREKNTFKLEGMMGTLMRMAGGGSEVTTTVAVRGNRMSRLDKDRGQIIDLAEEKVYSLDMKKKEYTVMTFAEMRAQMEQARAEAEKNMAALRQPDQPGEAPPEGVELEFDVKADETGERKQFAGQDARQVILTITARQKDVTLEQGGGFVMTSDMWLAPEQPAVHEIGEFSLKFFQAVYGDLVGFNPQQTASLSAMFPAFGDLSTRMQEEGRKLQGSPLMTVTTFETVRSEEQLKQAQAQQPSGGGGIGGMLARRLASRNAPQARSTMMTTTHEVESVSTSVSDADVAIPAGFKEKA